MTKERIELIREILLPFVKENLTKINYEDQGKHDAEEFEKDFNEILNLAIKALEQESCEDAISRQAVIEYIKASDAELGHSSEKEIVVEDILNMSPVIPTKCIATVKFSKEDMQKLVNEKMKDIVVERKKGKWINKSQKSGCGITFVASECTCCGKKTLFNCDELLYRYCPNCGAEMESEE